MQIIEIKSCLQVQGQIVSMEMRNAYAFTNAYPIPLTYHK